MKPARLSCAPSRPALGIDKALEEISKIKGVLYDEKVVNACVKLFNKKGFKFATAAPYSCVTSHQFDTDFGGSIPT